ERRRGVDAQHGAQPADGRRRGGRGGWSSDGGHGSSSMDGMTPSSAGPGGTAIPSEVMAAMTGHPYGSAMATAAIVPVGDLLRGWRKRRRRSQMDLAHDVGATPRHLGFVEPGRSRPSPEMVLAVARHLEVPLREQNA